MINGYTGYNQPEAYVAYEKYAVLDFYEAFITGFFADNVQWIILLIAFGQLLIAGFFMASKDLVRYAVIGATIFFLAIAPLGYGSAFPASLREIKLINCPL